MLVKKSKQTKFAFLNCGDLLCSLKAIIRSFDMHGRPNLLTQKFHNAWLIELCMLNAGAICDKCTTVLNFVISLIDPATQSSRDNSQLQNLLWAKFDIVI